MSDATHPVVPIAVTHERQAVGADRQAAIERARAMLEQRAAMLRRRRREVRIMLPGFEQRAFEKRQLLIQHAGVAAYLDIMGDRIRQPEKIVRTAGSHAPPDRWMPPMLDIAFRELMGRGAQQMRARSMRQRQRQRHRVLQLIAKAVRAPGLIERRAGPEPTDDSLIL